MNKNPEKLKTIVREKYSAIAAQSSRRCCCGQQQKYEYSKIGEEYRFVPGHFAEADLGLGCGLPTEFADLHSGQAVLDLGSGAGNDCFVARAIVGKTGKVTGLDFTDEMLEKARINNLMLGYKNVEFVKGDIEDIPLPDESYDRVVSNCVLNLVPSKNRAFSELFRVLKPGGKFCISDIVLVGELHPKLKNVAEMYAGCVSGAIQKKDYISLLKETGFTNVEIKKERETVIPETLLKQHLTEDEIEEFGNSGVGIFSITVTGEK